MFGWFKKGSRPGGSDDQFFHQMEDRLTRATTLQLAYKPSGVLAGDAVRCDCSGIVVVATGNRVRSTVETAWRYAGAGGPFDLASDGTLMTVNPSMESNLGCHPFGVRSDVTLPDGAPGLAVAAPDRLDHSFRHLISRYGTTMHLVLALPGVASPFPWTWSYVQ